jgi:hypothetical protein
MPLEIRSPSVSGRLASLSGIGVAYVRVVLGSRNPEANVPDGVEYKGWVIEAHSSNSDGDRWRPHGLAIMHVGSSTREHHVSALPNVMYDTEQDANAYAVEIAKKWIDNQDWRP